MEYGRVTEMRNDTKEYTAIKKRRGGIEDSYTKYPVDTERLKKLIDESQYSTAQLSRMVSNKSNSILYHWCDGTVKHVKYAYGSRLCELLNVPFEYLFHPDSSSDRILPRASLPRKKRLVLFESKPETEEKGDHGSDLVEIKKLLISINNGIANLCKKWD